jgi:quercetin dioxygenase-like cupin family protein
VVPIQSSASWNLIESALEETMALVAKSEPSPRTRAILVEARRLRSSIASWRAIPPRPATRKEVFDTAMLLLRKASGHPSTAPPPAFPAPPFPPPAAFSTDPPFESALRGSSRPPVSPSRPDVPAILRVSSPTPGPAPAITRPPSSAPTHPRREVIAPGVTIHRPKSMEWRAFALLEGVTVKVLRRELAGVVLHALVRLAPRAEIPKHKHATPEEILMLDGALVMGDVTMRPGEYCHADAGSIHCAAHAPNGCTFLLIGSEKNEILLD